MSKGKEIATQPKAFTSDDTSRRPDTDCAELVWENGQITMQGQFSKARRGPNSSIFPTTHICKPQDNNRTGNGLKMTNKLSTMDSMLGDFSLPGSSYEVALDQDVEMSPWLNYTDEEESLHHEYTSDFLRELSGVTINDLPTKKSGFFNSSVIDSMENVKNGNSSKSLSSVKTSGLSQFSIPVHPNFSKSGITVDTTSKLHGGQPSTSSSITNFPYFSLLGFIRDNHHTVKDSSILENEHKRCTLSTGTHVGPTFSIQKDAASHNQSLLTHTNENSELRPSNQASVCQEDVTVKNNTITKSIMVEEGNKEPAVVATLSVCSGNSLERASNAYAPDLKRKSRETTESDGPSDEADEESIGVRKGGGHRTGAKRGRAAEVHNQSERRRRDRINEKMRALQELIPNCNKVDKASMLDEAIEYLKTLQLQVQMLSMGGGMYMHPMMVPPGMQQVHVSQIPQFSPMGMGFGMNMPFQGPQYPVPGPHPVPVTGPAFHFRGSSSNLHSFGNPSQGIPMHMQTAPLLPLKVASVSGSANEVHLGSSSSSKYVAPQSVDSNNAKSNMNLTSNQVTSKGIECPESDKQA